MDHAVDLFYLTDTNRTYLREWLPGLDAVVEPADTLGFSRVRLHGSAVGVIVLARVIVGEHAVIGAGTRIGLPAI